MLCISYNAVFAHPDGAGRGSGVIRDAQAISANRTEYLSGVGATSLCTADGGGPSYSAHGYQSVNYDAPRRVLAAFLVKEP